MNLADLLTTGPASFHLTTATSAALGDAVVFALDAHPAAAVRRIRGTRSRTVKTWFDELSAALQFPWYFGSNWAALDDMLTDLSWLRADSHLLVVEDAEELLADEIPDALAMALKLFAQSRIQLVLQAPAEGRIAAALAANGTAFDLT